LLDTCINFTVGNLKIFLTRDRSCWNCFNLFARSRTRINIMRLHIPLIFTGVFCSSQCIFHDFVSSTLLLLFSRSSYSSPYSFLILNCCPCFQSPWILNFFSQNTVVVHCLFCSIEVMVQVNSALKSFVLMSSSFRSLLLFSVNSTLDISCIMSPQIFPVLGSARKIRLVLR
jgi:hypothetical protein